MNLYSGRFPRGEGVLGFVYGPRIPCRPTTESSFGIQKRVLVESGVKNGVGLLDDTQGTRFIGIISIRRSLKIPVKESSQGTRGNSVRTLRLPHLPLSPRCSSPDSRVSDKDREGSEWTQIHARDRGVYGAIDIRSGRLEGRRNAP